MICEHVVDVSVPQVVRHLFVVPISQAKTESCSKPCNRFLAVPVTLIVEQLVDVPRQNLADIPVPQAVKELLEISKVSPWTGFNSVFLLAVSLAEKPRQTGEINHGVSVPMKQFILPKSPLHCRIEPLCLHASLEDIECLPELPC